ncbi:outer membrane protein assembly factor BamB [Stutzerimonas urumqiensis]|uniref:outer membrane protein assembly factor BamB n=1 Tax=Stutzerimonas urumqiensis TaxID=638269 RepID=UPI000EB1ACD2|nr:outer membrane protein assembly factor BamB [Stutzerimonas urumqiensis]
MKGWKVAALLSLAAIAAGCSSNSSKEPEPSELVEFEHEVQLDEQWSRSIGEGQGETYNRLMPVVYGDQLYVTDVEGLVVSIDRESGKVNWKVELDEPVSGGVGAGYGLVLVGTMNGDVIALDVADGTKKWRASVGSEVLSAPAINGDIVLVQTQDDTLVALEADSGERRWSYESSPAVLTLRGTGAPLLTNQLAIAGLSTGKVIALDTRRGLPVWEQRIAIPQGRSELERIVDIDGTLLQSGGKLYVVTFQGRAAVLDLESGRILWQRDASSASGTALGYGSVYLSLADGTVQGIDERSNTVLWSNDQLARRQLSGPEVFSSYVVVGDKEGYLHLLSQVDGRFVGRTRVDSSGIRARAVVEGDWLYVYANDGSLVAYTLR